MEELKHELKIMKLWMVRMNKQIKSLEGEADAQQSDSKVTDETEEEKCGYS